MFSSSTWAFFLRKVLFFSHQPHTQRPSVRNTSQSTSASLKFGCAENCDKGIRAREQRKQSTWRERMYGAGYIPTEGYSFLWQNMSPFVLWPVGKIQDHPEDKEPNTPGLGVWVVPPCYRVAASPLFLLTAKPQHAARQLGYQPARHSYEVVPSIKGRMTKDSNASVFTLTHLMCGSHRNLRNIQEVEKCCI